MFLRVSVLTVLVVLGLASTVGASHQAFGPELHLNPDEEFAGAPFSAHTWGFLPGEELRWFWDDGAIEPVDGGSTRARPDGSSSQAFHVPEDAAGGRHVVSVVGETEASASADFYVFRRTDGSVYRLPSSTTSTTAETTATTEVSGQEEAATATSGDERVSRSGSTAGASSAITSTTAREERDVPDRFGLQFEGRDGSDGPPSWLPALVPAAIVAGVIGRLFARRVSPDDP